MQQNTTTLSAIGQNDHDLQTAKVLTSNRDKPMSLLMKPIADVDSIVEAYKSYQTLKTRLLGNSDYQEIQGKMFIKKSWFRKLACSFWISTKIIKEERRELKDSDGVPYFIYEITARSTSPNWRYSEACASCASNERKFSHVENDVRATGQTRAVNRSVSDLIWWWEVSAEEMTSNKSISSKPTYADKHVDKPAIHRSHHHELITQPQKNLLIKLIERKYVDAHTRNDFYQKIKSLTKIDASAYIKSMLATS